MFFMSRIMILFYTEDKRRLLGLHVLKLFRTTYTHAFFVSDVVHLFGLKKLMLSVEESPVAGRSTK